MKSLREHRLEAGLTLEQVAEKVSTWNNKYSHQTIADWETKGLPRSVRLWKMLSELYDVELNDLPLR